jgi:hypothetical protein
MPEGRSVGAMITSIGCITVRAVGADAAEYVGQTGHTRVLAVLRKARQACVAREGNGRRMIDRTNGHSATQLLHDERDTVCLV